MNKTTALAQNPSEGPQRDPLHGKKRSGSIRDTPSDSHNEDVDKAQQPHFASKTTSQFDCSDLGLFFGSRSTQAKASAPELFVGKAPCQKTASQGSTNKEGNSQKQPSSKDFSNLEELVEDTTIIPNPDEAYSELKKKPIEAPVETKIKSVEAGSELVESMSPENGLNHHLKKKSIEKFFPAMKTLKEEKAEQDLTADFSKIGFMMDDDQEKPGLTNYGDIKASKNNLKVLERIKSKALPSRYGAFNPSIYEDPKMPEAGQTESRTNNNSVFAGTNVGKLTKAVNPFSVQYQDILNDGNNEQQKYFTQFFEKKNGTSEDIPLDKSKEISQNDLNPRLLTEKTVPRNTRMQANEFIPSSARENRNVRANISLVSTDSTVDSENLNAQNNSFSTPYSVASTKFDNISPVKIDSGRMQTGTPNRTYSMQGLMNMNMVNQGMSMMHTQRMSATNLNQSYMNMSYLGYGSNTNSDHSANLSFNDDFMNSYNTPQASQQQNFLNQSFNMQPNLNQSFNMQPNMNNRNSMPSNAHRMEKQFFVVPSMNEPTTYRNQTDNSFSMMNQSPNPNNQEKRTNTNDKNGTRMRRKNDGEDGNNFEIDLDKVESCGRTTAMIRNIPNKYDLTLILETIERNHKGKFDFFYLPIDFSNRCNFGYAFINFASAKYLKDFYNEFNGKKWEKFNSEKICEIKYARIQGQAALMQHFQYSRVMNQQDKKLRPYVPTKYNGLPNKQKIEELVRQQKLASANNQ